MCESCVSPVQGSQRDLAWMSLVQGWGRILQPLVGRPGCQNWDDVPVVLVNCSLLTWRGSGSVCSELLKLFSDSKRQRVQNEEQRGLEEEMEGPLIIE